MVYTAPDRDRAVFLTVADIATLRQSIAAFRTRPTVAGPPLDASTFDQLDASLGRSEGAAEGQRSIALTPAEQQQLELLMDQAAIHAALPLRIRRTCTACGSERIVNPALPKQRSGGSDKVGSIVSSVQLLSEGHPFLAGLNFLAGASGGADAPPVCERCEGVDFRDTPVTFCPACHEPRAEALLLTCPDCSHTFAPPADSSGPRDTADGIWTSVRSATDAFTLSRNAALLRAQSTNFENGFYPDQLTMLVESLGPDDDLICVCRCGLPTELRYVALLLTSDQLVWSRQTMLSSPTGGKLAWRDIAEIRELAGGPSPGGIEIVGLDGQVLRFANFKGSGLTFGNHQAVFTADGIREHARLLHARHRPVPAPNPVPLPPAPTWAPLVMATPPAPRPAPAPSPPPAPPVVSEPPTRPLATPAPFPPPPVPPAVPPPASTYSAPAVPQGWYADPWRAARLRWWDGTRWTWHIAA